MKFKIHLLRMGWLVASAALWAVLSQGALAQNASAPTAQTGQVASGPDPAPQRVLKRKVAIARFTNISRYGKSLLSDGDRDPLAEQAADMLTARLVESGKFLVFERSAQSQLGQEATNLGAKASAQTGVDAVIIGSVTEFGRKLDGVAGFLNSTIRQTASATVEVRLVDVRTGQAFFSTKGVGNADTTAKEVAGFGGRAGYDATLNDKAISAAISDLINNVVARLSERRWSSDVLQIRKDTIFISGGPSQGLAVGDRFVVETRGETLVSGQTGLPITLPGEQVAEVELVSFFGDQPTSEGALARITSGSLAGRASKDLVVVEKH